MGVIDKFKDLFASSEAKPSATNVPTTNTIHDAVKASSKAQREKDSAREAALFAGTTPNTYIPGGVSGYTPITPITPIPQVGTKAAPTSPQRAEKASTSVREYKRG